ncbi:conjugal transfer protein TraS [Paracidovorax citrulli]
MAAESLKVGRAWDDDFQGWAADLQLGRKLKKPAKGASKASTWSGKQMPSREPSEYPGKGNKADVRARLQGVARRSRQVMVKITPGKNHTMRAVRRHLQYIGEDGQGVVYDHNGREYRGTEEVNDLAWMWQHTGPKMPEETDVRLAFNIMFSMPEGTDERAVYAAVKATADAEFAGHQWAMGQHFDEPQVHCHVAVKAEGMDGVRLNPRKADLQRWRERFAHELRERGVEAEATRRATRLHQQRINKPWAVTRLEERGESTNPAPAQPEVRRVERWKDTEKRAASSYDRIIDALHRSSDAADRVLAKELAESLVGQQARRTVRQDTRTKPELERT